MINNYMNTIELTDDFRTEEPLAYLVKCLPSCATCEYRIFLSDHEAKNYANYNGIQSDNDWNVYPLYASHPIEQAS